MILLVDAGNSLVKWATWQDGRWLERGALPAWRLGELTAVLAARPGWVGLSCVAGEAVRERLDQLFASAGVEVFRLAPQAMAHGLTNHYARPDSLGADRYAIAIAVHRMGLSPCVAVSAGTALTVDAITGEGEFLGGMILPGAGLMRRALAVGTAALANADGVWQSFPAATGDAVATGIWTALSAAVLSMHERLSARLGQRAGLVVTGGNAPELAARLRDIGCPLPVELKENLVLEGLLWVARDLDVPGA